MVLDRRFVMTGLGTLAFAACTQTATPRQLAAQTVEPEFIPIQTPEFLAWVAQFRSRARNEGISTATLDAAFADAGFIPGVVDRDRNQIQTRRTFEEYLSIVASDERISKGRAALQQHGATLRAIEAQYGVDRYIVAAIWGTESFYGERRGTIPVISSTATLAFDGRRGSFYESQLIAALKILQSGDTIADNLVGSWAGAMGHTQFIPTSYEGFAVDYTGDGRRDIWSDDPSDSLASTAAYLSRNGWRTGLKWGAEEGTSGGAQGRVVEPQAGGVRFVVAHNFDVLKTYNNSDFYALGVGHLADRIGGAGPLRGSFPPDANGLTKEDRMAVQRGLLARGYEIGDVDGVIGRRSVAAINDFQRRQGIAVTGVATPDLLARLR